MAEDLSTLLYLIFTPVVPLCLYSAMMMPLWSVLTGLAALWTFTYIIQRLLELLEIPNLHNKAVFITGCDTGFGNQLALKCLQRGMPVFAGCLIEQGATDLREEATTRNLTGLLRTIILNVADDKSVADTVAILNEESIPYGGLHGVVNNAGISGNSFYDDMLNIEDYKQVAEVNAFGVVRVSQMTKHLVKKTRGRIVTTTSVLARVGLVALGPYIFSKFAASGYCEVIRQELRPFGVSVHILEPGCFKTPITDHKRGQASVDMLWKRLPQNLKEEYGDDFIREVRKRTALLDNYASPDIDQVVNAYFHALTARFPRLRYQIGADAQFFYFPLSFCSAGVRDGILRLISKVIGMPLPDVCR